MNVNRKTMRCHNGLYHNFLAITLGMFAACGQDGSEHPEVSSLHASMTIPSGYRVITTRSGVQCYQKDNAGGAPDYVCIVDLRQARVRTVHSARSGDNFGCKSLRNLWNDAAALESGIITRAIVINGTFFGTDFYPTQFAFPYKQEGTLLTYGKDCPAHVPSVRNLHLWWDRQYAAVSTYSCSAVDQAALTSFGSAPDILGTLDWTYSKNSTSPIPRTFVGVQDQDGNGTRETLLIFSSALATQSYARQQLINFGANEIVMFDGGGSSALIINGIDKVSTARTLPNALVVLAGP